MPALTIAIPLLTAAVLMALSHAVPRRLADTVALAVTGTVLGLCLVLARRSVEEPIVYWFGGWQPRGGVAVGIAFYVDSLAAGLAALAALLTFGSMLFTWHFFDSVGTLFHVLMLVFLAALAGFCFSGDIFTLFVLFELMSAAAFALTGYKIEASALEGALNFAITNSIAAFFVLWGIGLLYARTGALNLAQLGEVLAGGSPDALVGMAFALISCGFFIKGAIVPFHFWLADAHAVAPTPVCVLFSGVMVEMGLYAATRVWWTVFSGVLAEKQSLVGSVWVAAGAVTALLGGIACFTQRHLKRLLALSTVSHMGVVLMGLGQFTAEALAGAAIYVAGHALVKGTLFLCSGILLHRLGDVDVVNLRGRGRRLHITATTTVLAGLGLAGMPPFSTFVGKAILDESMQDAGPWAALVGLIAAALTAAGVLRAAGRIFFGFGPPSDEEQEAATEKEHRETREGRRRVPWSMLTPAIGMIVLALSLGCVPGLGAWHESQARRFQDRQAYVQAVLHAPSKPSAVISPSAPDLLGARSLLYGCGSAAGAVFLAALALWIHKMPPTLRTAVSTVTSPFVACVEALHSGRANDYVAWLVAGLATFALCMAW